MALRGGTVRAYLQAITAVRTAIELAPALDATLSEVLAGPLAFADGAAVS